jgi:uncharacterized DUF497 family protein
MEFSSLGRCCLYTEIVALLQEARSEAQLAFLDPHRVIIEDPSHSREEKRYFLFGQVGDGCLTVRFTYRRRKIRIFGAGFWRKGREIYEEKNQIY